MNNRIRSLINNTGNPNKSKYNNQRKLSDSLNLKQDSKQINFSTSTSSINNSMNNFSNSSQNLNGIINSNNSKNNDEITIDKSGSNTSKSTRSSNQSINEQNKNKINSFFNNVKNIDFENDINYDDDIYNLLNNNNKNSNVDQFFFLRKKGNSLFKINEPNQFKDSTNNNNLWKSNNSTINLKNYNLDENKLTHKTSSIYFSRNLFHKSPSNKFKPIMRNNSKDELLKKYSALVRNGQLKYSYDINSIYESNEEDNYENVNEYNNDVSPFKRIEIQGRENTNTSNSNQNIKKNKISEERRISNIQKNFLRNTYIMRIIDSSQNNVKLKPVKIKKKLLTISERPRWMIGRGVEKKNIYDKGKH